MKAEEIRARAQSTIESDRIEREKLLILYELTAQIAELNEKLGKLAGRSYFEQVFGH